MATPLLLDLRSELRLPKLLEAGRCLTAPRAGRRWWPPWLSWGCPPPATPPLTALVLPTFPPDPWNCWVARSPCQPRARLRTGRAAADWGPGADRGPGRGLPSRLLRALPAGGRWSGGSVHATFSAGRRGRRQSKGRTPVPRPRPDCHADCGSEMTLVRAVMRIAS